MDNSGVPDLNFPDVKVGKISTPRSLQSLIYLGGTSVSVDKVANKIAEGEFGKPLTHRVELVKRLHEEMSYSLKQGGATSSVTVQINYLRMLFRFAESSDYIVDIDTVIRVYLHWSDHLVHRVRTVRDLKPLSAYNYVVTVGTLLDKVFERGTPIVSSTRLRSPKKNIRVRSVAADKQNLQETFAFGSMLLDIMDGLTLNSLWGELPLRIQLRTGQELIEWSWMTPSVHQKTASCTLNGKISQTRQDRMRAQSSSERTLTTRFPLANLRIEAELLFFISQTGMNLAQAHRIKLRHFSYTSSLNGYVVRDYKHRRQGEVLFEIYAEYKAIFERYLNWRNEVFPDSEEGLVFPLFRRGRTEDKAPNFGRILNTCKKLGIKFIAPSRLRHTRINWLLRRSGDDDLTAEQSQHSKRTLIHVYEEPSLQRAMAEVMHFWEYADPVKVPPSPGVCSGIPMPIDTIEQGATQPDCVSPSGCLWCVHHRDIDSFDYVWAIASFRYLKSLELAKYHPPEKKNLPTHPSIFSINRLSAKLKWFHQSNELRKEWVSESLSRIEEGEFHSAWSDLIQSIESSV